MLHVHHTSFHLCDSNIFFFVNFMPCVKFCFHIWNNTMKGKWQFLCENLGQCTWCIWIFLWYYEIKFVYEVTKWYPKCYVIFKSIHINSIISYVKVCYVKSYFHIQNKTFHIKVPIYLYVKCITHLNSHMTPSFHPC